MERMITVGLAVLLVSLTAPNAKANTQAEARQQQAQPTQTQPLVPTEYSTNTVDQTKAEPTLVVNQPQLSERDRIIREYQTQTIIPAQ